jgi:SnoaL-like domain
MSSNTNHWDTTSSEVGATERILQSVLAALNEGKRAEVADRFDDHFTFTDHALKLEFSDKGRLIEFLQKSRELFPDTAVESDAISECRDQAVVQWKHACPAGESSVQVDSGVSARARPPEL